MIKTQISNFIGKNYDLVSICSIDIATSLSDIDLIAKALTSVLVLLIAIKRLLIGKKEKKDK